MKLFVDSANLADIEDALRTGAVSGVTTNPSILAKDGVTNPLRHYKLIRDLFDSYAVQPSLSVELVQSEPIRMIEEALRIVNTLDYSQLAIKVPMRWEWLTVVRQLRANKTQVNVTACMSYAQAIVAADAGATFVSLFWGRIRDFGQRPQDVVTDVHETFRLHGSPTRIIVGSIRSTRDVTDAIAAGADIVTVPPPFLAPLTMHPKTDEVIAQFMRDAHFWEPVGRCKRLERWRW